VASAAKKQALGRGLSALLKDPENDIKSVDDKNADQVIGNVVELDLDSIEVNPFQPRTTFNDAALQELAGSIKELGIIQPITVRKVAFNKFQLVSGERRFRASKLVGRTTIPAYIRIANDQESLEMALVENIQREDLDPIEIALSYQRLIDDVKLTQEKLSERVGKKRSTITNYLRLLKLHPLLQNAMRDGELSMGHGRALVNIDSEDDQLGLFAKVKNQHLSVRATEQLVKGYKEKGQSPAKSNEEAGLPSYISKHLGAMEGYLETAIQVSSSARGKGKIVIPFHSKEEFKRLKKLLSSGE
jgi:ParB family chromosome partitioning protein